MNSKYGCALNHKLLISEDTNISGQINYLLQVLNILISNAKDSYEGENGIIDLTISKDKLKIIIAAKDYGKGILTC